MKISRRSLVFLSRNSLLLFSIVSIFIISIVSYSKNIVENNKEKGTFSGKISFNDSLGHKIYTTSAHVQRINDRGNTVIVLTAKNDNSPETVYIKLYNVQGIGTHFIPGGNAVPNVGNLIENIENYRSLSNFYQTTLPNREGVQNGVGRVNITKLTPEEIEGELIIIANNSEGRQALLESATFKAKF